jgi:hypothetical protein
MFQLVVPSFLDQISQPFVTCTKMKVASTHSFHLRHLLLTLQFIFTLGLHLRSVTPRIDFALSERHLNLKHTLNSQSQQRARDRKHHGRLRQRPLSSRAARQEPASKTRHLPPHRPHPQSLRHSKPRQLSLTPTSSSTSSSLQFLVNIEQHFAESRRTGKRPC